MRYLCGSVALVLCLAGAADAQAAGPSIDSAFTDYDTKTCPHRAGRDVEDYGEWRCRGLNGIAVLVSAGDQRMTMSFGPRAKDEPAVRQTLQRFNDLYAARIEWRFVREAGGRIRPFAAIVRWNTFLLAESDTPGKADAGRPKAVRGKVLVVTRLGPEACAMSDMSMGSPIRTPTSLPAGLPTTAPARSVAIPQPG